eukprot:136337-Chlamydomonas_euryale.AAC.2
MPLCDMDARHERAWPSHGVPAAAVRESRPHRWLIELHAMLIPSCTEELPVTVGGCGQSASLPRACVESVEVKGLGCSSREAPRCRGRVWRVWRGKVKGALHRKRLVAVGVCVPVRSEALCDCKASILRRPAGV